MKMVGFLAEHEKNILGAAIHYNFSDEPQARITEKNEKSVLKYLGSGRYIFGMTLAIEVANGKFISPYIVYGDGEWLWPAYLAYYIELGIQLTLPVAFLQHLVSNKFEFPEITHHQEEQAKAFFMKLLSINHRNAKK